MRGNRAFILVSAHLLFLSLLVSLVYLLFQSSFSSTNSLEDQRSFSKIIFGLLVILELVMISFVAPALTAGSISMERERHTYDLLRVTLLSTRSLVFGKFSSALTFIFLLLITSIPMLSPAFIMGGVLASEILVSILILSTGAITFCAIGLFFSSIIHRTLLANVLSYACAVFLMFGIPVMAVTALVTFQSGNTFRVENLSPIAITVWVILAWIVISLSPLATIITTEFILLEQNSLWWVEIPLKNDLSLHILSPWVCHLVFYGLLVLVLIWITIQRLNSVE